jgi:hypothetical protein
MTILAEAPAPPTVEPKDAEVDLQRGPARKEPASMWRAE